MSSPTPILPTLDYAPPPLSPVRLSTLALGTALIAAAMGIALIQSFLIWRVLHIVSLPQYYTAQLLIAQAEHAAVLAGIVLLARALPPRLPATRRATIFAIAAAATQWLLDIVASLLFLADGARLAPPSYPPWFTLVVILSILGMALRAALVIVAALYLAAVGTRLQRRTLGLAAAAALAPTFLLKLYGAAYNALLLPSVLHGYPLAPAWSLPNKIPASLKFYEFLLWSALTLTALILYRREIIYHHAHRNI